jgi:hypothetical protein
MWGAATQHLISRGVLKNELIVSRRQHAEAALQLAPSLQHRTAELAFGCADNAVCDRQIVLDGVAVAVPMIGHGQHETNRAIDRGLVSFVDAQAAGLAAFVAGDVEVETTFVCSLNIFDDCSLWAAKPHATRRRLLQGVPRLHRWTAVCGARARTASCQHSTCARTYGPCASRVLTHRRPRYVARMSKTLLKRFLRRMHRL